MHFWKKISAFILLTVILASTFQQAVLVADYYINKAAYAKSCINKYRPQMHCNGQCQLMKKLKQQEDKEQKVPELKLENKIEVLSSKSFFPSFVFNIIKERYNYSLVSDNRTVDRSESIFHPPAI